MARDEITLVTPLPDASQSAAVGTVTPKTITQANGTKIVNAFGCKDNSLHITVANTATSAKKLTIKAGVFDNAVLGDLIVPIAASSVNAVIIENPSRFQQADGSILLDYEAGFAGTVYAAGKHAGLSA